MFVSDILQIPSGINATNCTPRLQARGPLRLEHLSASL